MKKAFKKALLIFVLLFMAAGVLPMTVSAADPAPASPATRWNIMLVIDASRSLTLGAGSKKPTDETGLRFEAVDSFIDTIQNGGNYVGAIVFTAYEGSDATDENMRKGVYYNSWENGPVELNNNQSTLKNSIRDASVKAQRALRATNSGETDIGTAILVAEESLEAAAAQNGLPCAMFVFTDGSNELNHTYTQNASESNMARAESMMQANGTRMCGVLLNSNNNVNPAELRDVVARANGIANGSLSLGNYFIEITDPISCSEATDLFMELLGFSLAGDDGEIISSSCDKTFRVPGVGVEEANIRIQSGNGQAIPDSVDVSITQPDGTVIAGGNAAAICSTSAGKNYRIYKLTAPMPGEWKVHIEIPEDLTVSIKYNPIFSIYIAADYETSVPYDQLHANMTTEITAYLELNGNRVFDPNSYSGYDCTFVLKSVDGTETEYPISQDGNGEYKLTLLLDYGEYYAGVKFTCDQLEATSSMETEDFWDLKNHAPTSSNERFKVTYGLFDKNIKDYDLYYLKDIEDGKNLTLTAESSEFDVSAVSFNAGTMTVNGKIVGAGVKNMTVTATDSQCAQTQFNVQFSVKCVTLRNVSIILAVVIVIAVVAILIIRMITKHYPDGDVRLDFAVPDEDGRSSGEVEIHAELTPPGNGTPRKQTLYDLIRADMSRSSGSILTECAEKHISEEAVQQHINNLAGALKKIKVKCVLGKDQGKRCAKLKVSGIGVVYNNSVSLMVGGYAMGFGYYPNSGDDDTDDYLNYPTGGNDYYTPPTESNQDYAGSGYDSPSYGGSYGADNAYGGSSSGDSYSSDSGYDGSSSGGSYSSDSGYGGYGSSSGDSFDYSGGYDAGSTDYSSYGSASGDSDSSDSEFKF